MKTSDKNLFIYLIDINRLVERNCRKNIESNNQSNFELKVIFKVETKLPIIRKLTKNDLDE